MNSKRGFSLLELVLAVTLFSLGSFTLASMIIDSSVSTRMNTDKINSLLYIKEAAEAVRSIRDLDWASLVDGDYGLDDSSGAWVFSGASDLIDSKYTRVTSIVSSSTAAYLKDISINVSWEQPSGNISSTTLIMLLSNWPSVEN